MEKAIKKRVGIRRSYNLTHDELDLELQKEVVDLALIKVLNKLLVSEYDKLKECDEGIMDRLDNAEGTEEAAYLQELSSVKVFDQKFVTISLQVEAKLNPRGETERETRAPPNNESKSFKLPKIELKKFSGELKEWIGFWAQFEKIHEDKGLHASDKFQYLIQSMVEGSRARELVESYPQSSDKYPKVVDALKDRFGKKDLLAEVYVRELLKLVLLNVQAKEKVPLSKLYDQLESKIRALESLGVTSENVMLYPLVESCLPEELLRIWQRNLKSESTTKLNDLLKFLSIEVNNEEKITMAREGFRPQSSSKKQGSRREESSQDIPTVAGLTIQSESKSCVFCSKAHESRDCYSARKMTLEEKKAKISAGRCCYICLKKSHVAKFCKASISCQVCCKRHLVIMCPELKAKGSDFGAGASEKSDKSVPAKSLSMNNQLSQQSSSVLLQTMHARLVDDDGKSKLIRILFDSAAMRTCVLKSVIEGFNFEHLGSELVQHTVFGGGTIGDKIHERYRIRVESMDKRYSCTFQALDQDPKICGSIPQVPRGPWMAELKKNRMWISDFGDEVPEIELLIGADVYGQFLTGRVRKLQSGLTAIETVLGWTLLGPTPEVKLCNSSVAMTTTSMLVTEFSVPQLWELETIGIRDPSETKSRLELEEDARVHFLKTVTQDEKGRYSVNLPWTTDTEDLQSNRTIAEQRLRRATQKLKVNCMFTEYGDIFREWEKDGIIEEVPREDQVRCHYLPHRPVIKSESATTKIRPVFDASCKGKEDLSLNDCLEKGPNILELIPTVLLRFREKKRGVTSDIKKAFLQIGITKAHRDYLRFLWWEDGSDEIKVYRHCRVVFGINCSPFLLGAVIHHHLSKLPEEKKMLGEKLWKSLYVDNCVTSVDTVQDLIEFRHFAVTALASAQMDLRLWETSLEDSGIGLSTDEKCGLESTELGDFVKTGSTTVLGLCWDKAKDVLKVKFDEITVPDILTKRVVLSIVQKLFDPLGFMSPVSIVPKLLLQKAWSLKLGWDAALPVEVVVEFKKWLAGVAKISEICVPRRMTEYAKEDSCWSLHTFVDASKDAYAAAVFLRCEKEGKVSVQLIQSKSRVSPLKKTTIPRLELLACLIGSRLAKSIVEALCLHIRLYFWSDSATALTWIKRTENWGTFVGNRVKEIRASTNIEDWRHVPGINNPADLPSRGCNAEELLKVKWWEGPKWLKLKEEDWPVAKVNVDEEIVAAEKKKTVISVVVATAAPDAWYLRRFSSYTKIVRLVCWISRVRVSDPEKKPQVLTVEEIASAENKLLKLVQQEAGISTDSFQHLRIFKDGDGLYRLETKITRREDLCEFVQPVVLPKNHKLVELLVRETHLQNCHAGVQLTMQLLREKYWIVSSRQLVKKVVSSCVRCRRFAGKKLEVITPSLPLERVQDCSVFSVTGCDLAGPMYLKGGRKCWIVLYTCAVYRAAHLELVSSLSTDGFLLTLRRFIARRGRPSVMWTDLGTNFQGASNLLKDVDWNQIEADSSVKRIQWRFNPAASPWWGGWWERLVRLIKSLLLRILGRSVLDFEELYTVLCDVEAVINARPMSYVSEDQDDLLPLSPSMFLKDLSSTEVPDLDSLDGASLQKRHRYRQKLRDEFKKRFRNEYLSQLIQKAKEKNPGSIKIGEIVLIGSDDKKRMNWPLGRVVELIPGPDGVVRVVKLKTCNGFLVRPLQRVYPLEVEIGTEDVVLEDPGIVNDTIVNDMAHDCNEKVDDVPVVKTRSGRVVKIPNRFKI